MNNNAHLHRLHLEALRAVILQEWPEAIVGPVEAEREAGISSLVMVFPNGLVISVSNDPARMLSLFVVLRIVGGPDAALPFEATYRHGFGGREAQSADGVLRTLSHYASLGGGTSGVRASVPSGQAASVTSPYQV